MSLRSALPLALGLLLSPAPCFANDLKAIERDLNRAYHGRVVILRSFSSGDLLRYDADGKLIEARPTGPWTLDAEIQVQKIEVRGNDIEIKGRRLWFVYDRFARRFVDIEGPAVRLEIESEPGSLTFGSFQDLAVNIFLGATERLEDFVPPYWKQFLSGPASASKAGQPSKTKPPGVRPLDIRRDPSIRQPVPIDRPDPPYTQAARSKKLQGIVVMWVTIDTEGRVSDVSLVRPLGLGLDDQAVATISTWRFQPAMKDGAPVSVRLMVETSFRMF